MNKRKKYLQFRHLIIYLFTRSFFAFYSCILKTVLKANLKAACITNLCLVPSFSSPRVSAGPQSTGRAPPGCTRSSARWTGRLHPTPLAAVSRRCSSLHLSSPGCPATSPISPRQTPKDCSCKTAIFRLNSYAFESINIQYSHIHDYKP